MCTRITWRVRFRLHEPVEFSQSLMHKRMLHLSAGVFTVNTLMHHECQSCHPCKYIFKQQPFVGHLTRTLFSSSFVAKLSFSTLELTIVSFTTCPSPPQSQECSRSVLTFDFTSRAHIFSPQLCSAQNSASPNWDLVSNILVLQVSGVKCDYKMNIKLLSFDTSHETFRLRHIRTAKRAWITRSLQLPNLLIWSLPAPSAQAGHRTSAGYVPTESVTQWTRIVMK